MQGVGKDRVYDQTDTVTAYFVVNLSRKDSLTQSLKFFAVDSKEWDEYLALTQKVRIPVNVTKQGIAILHEASAGVWRWEDLELGMDGERDIEFSLTPNQSLLISSCRLKELRVKH